MVDVVVERGPWSGCDVRLSRARGTSALKEALLHPRLHEERIRVEKCPPSIWSTSAEAGARSS
jgi:hypothetical protein